MTWIVNNWYLIVAGIALLIFTVAITCAFLKLPTEVQEANLKEWLKYAVTEAEIELGSGTGQLKLRKVYAMATAHFPKIIRVVSFETFSGWVDEALVWLKEQLSTNENIAKIVKED